MLVLFDGDCPLCRFLAELMAKRAGEALAFEAWQDFVRHSPLLGTAEPGGGNAPASLAVWWRGELKQGEEAWSLVLQHHPDLEHLAWLAARVGLAKHAGAIAQRLGGSMRWLCPACRRRSGRGLSERK